MSFGKGFAIGCGISVVLFAGCGLYLFDSLRYVNEPRIKPEDHAKERTEWAELVPEDASDFRLLYRNVDHPVDIFTYRSNASLASVLQSAKKWWTVRRRANGYVEIELDSDPRERRDLPYGQIWCKPGRFLIALSQYPDVRNDPRWQDKITSFLAP